MQKALAVMVLVLIGLTAPAVSGLQSVLEGQEKWECKTLNGHRECRKAGSEFFQGVSKVDIEKRMR